MLKKALSVVALTVAILTPTFASADPPRVNDVTVPAVSVTQLMNLAEAVLDRVSLVQKRTASMFSDTYVNGTWSPAEYYGDERIKFNGTVLTSYEWFQNANNVLDKAWECFMNEEFKASLGYARSANDIFKMLAAHANP
ncbi:MAG: hypothetical protein IT350_19185 [Deltaproteobacteria bacterium]|nr:hypothetical protein [Deltaproteobacteria bacterium]